jgi:hypothetical protein
VASFIEDLGPEAQEHYARVKEAGDSNWPFRLPWLRRLRNATMHVPKLHPERYERGIEEDMAKVVGKAAALEGTVTHGDTVETVRFGLADVVSVQLLPWRIPA